MVKRDCRHGKLLGGPEPPELNTLFVETSLGTRLVTAIHASATVSDAKRKIALDHSQAFPGMRDIKIFNLQVQHHGHFYYLSESMPLACAFGEPTWYKSLFIEASISEHDEKVGILEAEVKTMSSLEGVDHGTGNVNAVPYHVGRLPLLLSEGREVSVCPSAGDEGRTAAPLAQFTNQEELLQDHLDPIANGHPSGTDEELAANPNIPEAVSKETSISHDTKKRKRAKKEVAGLMISSAEEQGKSMGADNAVNTDKNDNAVPQIENGVEMDQSVSADLLAQSEAIGNAGSIGPKRKKRKVERQNYAVVELSATDHGLSSEPLEEVANEDTNPQITLTQDAGKQASESVDVDVLSQREELEIIQNQEGNLPPIDGCLNEERAADIYGNVSRDDNGGTDENLVAGQSEDAQEIGISGNRKEKKKKRKRSRSSTVEVEDILTSGMEEQSRGAEGSEAPLIPIQEVENKTPQAMDVSFSVALREGEEALEKQEVLLPLVCVHPDHENPEELDGNAREVVTEDPAVTGKSNVEDPAVDQLGRDHEKGSSLMRKDKKKRKKGQTSTAPSMDVSVSVTPGEGEEALQKQESLLPLVGVHLDHENAEELDGNALEVVESVTEDPAVTEKPNVEGPVVDQLGRDQEKGSSLMKKEKKERRKRKKGQTSTAQNVTNSEMNQQSHSAEKRAEILTKPLSKGESSVQSTNSGFQIEKNDLGTASTEVPLKNRPEMEISDVSKVAKDTDDKIDFLTYFMPAKSQSEIVSSVNVIGASQSIKQKKVKDQHDAASTLLSETQGSGKSPDDQEDTDRKLEQSAEPKKVLPLTNKKLLKPSQDGGVARTSTLKKGKKPATASRAVGDKAAPPSVDLKRGSLAAKSKGPADAVQNTKIAKQNAMSTGKGSNGRSLLKSAGKAKSLFNTERQLFTHSESESSSGENKTTNADASNLPHSRTSSSDSSSDSESDASQDSIRKGNEDGKTSSGACKSVSSKKKFPSLGEMTMDAIIKSSRRFKKAKLTASQSQEPDSQA